MAWQDPKKSLKDLINSTITTVDEAGTSAEGLQDGLSTPNSDCPRGLERLIDLDRLIVDQQNEHLDILTGYGTKSNYVVMDIHGQVVYYAAEESGAFGKTYCGNSRPFEMRIIDTSMREVIRLVRPLNALLQEMDVFSNDQKLGSIIQTSNPVRPSFSICDATGRSVFGIREVVTGVDYDVLHTDDDNKVGEINKKWGGLARELFTDADSFGISFPIDLDPHMKAVFLGACFLIDFMYYENTSDLVVAE